jgi:hypothetical protein
MAKSPQVWLHCECGLIILSQDKVIAPLPHPPANAKGACPGKKFRIGVEPSPEDIRRAGAELERRRKKQALNRVPTKRAYKQGPGTNPWEAVRATSARPSKGTAGAPTLGKKGH